MKPGGQSSTHPTRGETGKADSFPPGVVSREQGQLPALFTAGTKDQRGQLPAQPLTGTAERV